jgi:hypothetical protein
MCISYTIYLVLYRVSNHEERGRNWRKDPTSKKHPETPVFVFFNLLETEGVWVDGLDGLDSASPIFVFVRGWRQVLLTRLSVPLPREARKKRNWESGQLDRVYTVCWREYGIYHVYGTGHRLASNYSKSLRRSGDIRSRQQFVLDLRFSKEFRSVLTFHSPLTAWR